MLPIERLRVDDLSHDGLVAPVPVAEEAPGDKLQLVVIQRGPLPR